jgi:hypothetical protein
MRSSFDINFWLFVELHRPFRSRRKRRSPPQADLVSLSDERPHLSGITSRFKVFKGWPPESEQQQSFKEHHFNESPKVFWGYECSVNYTMT